MHLHFEEYCRQVRKEENGGLLRSASERQKDEGQRKIKRQRKWTETAKAHQTK
jgi:hypothetical protein